MYFGRISQLTGKSNQFNLTTLRCSESDVKRFSESDEYITLYGQLSDRFGDNGIVSLLIGRKDTDQGILHMDLWLISCRVLKRDTEFAMLDAIIEKAADAGLNRIRGYYYPTAKNGMVREFYKTMGFALLDGCTEWPPERNDIPEGSTIWELDISKPRERRNTVIKVQNTASPKDN